jgi:hypothetical protein
MLDNLAELDKCIDSMQHEHAALLLKSIRKHSQCFGQH